MSAESRKSAAPEGLDRLERWMLEVVRHPEIVDVALASKEARGVWNVAAADLESVVLPSATLSAVERLGIYNNMYLARLEEVLEQDYSTVRSLVGHDAFKAIVAGYVTRHPSRHWSLSELGCRFADYLRHEASDLEHADLLAEVATIERAIEEVFEGPRAETVTPEQWQAFPPDLWAEARITLHPNIRLFEFAYPANTLLQSVLDSLDWRWPDPEPSRLLVYRREYTVWRSDLSPGEYATLCALRDKKTLGEAIECAVEATDGDDEVVMRELGRWFQHWTAIGLFSAVAADAEA